MSKIIKILCMDKNLSIKEKWEEQIKIANNEVSGVGVRKLTEDRQIEFSFIDNLEDGLSFLQADDFDHVIIDESIVSSDEIVDHKEHENVNKLVLRIQHLFSKSPIMFYFCAINRESRDKIWNVFKHKLFDVITDDINFKAHLPQTVFRML